VVCVQVKNNDNNAKWNEVLNIAVEDLSKSVLELTVYDSDAFGDDDKIGSSSIRVAEVLKADSTGTVENVWVQLKLKEKKRGRLLLKLLYTPF